MRLVVFSLVLAVGRAALAQDLPRDVPAATPTPAQTDDAEVPRATPPGAKAVWLQVPTEASVIPGPRWQLVAAHDGQFYKVRTVKEGRGMLVVGAILLGGGVMGSILIGSLLDRYGFIPLAGPFVAAGNNPTAGIFSLYFVLAGVMEGVGLGLTIAGSAIKPRDKVERRRVRLDLSPAGLVGQF